MFNKWGIVFCQALTGLIKAADQPRHSGTNRTNLDRALKLYAVLPQIIFRNPGRGNVKDAKITQQRLDQLIANEYRLLLEPWCADVRRLDLKTRKRQPDTEESRCKRAVDLTYKHKSARASAYSKALAAQILTIRTSESKCWMRC